MNLLNFLSSKERATLFKVRWFNQASEEAKKVSLDIDKHTKGMSEEQKIEYFIERLNINFDKKFLTYLLTSDIIEASIEEIDINYCFIDSKGQKTYKNLHIGGNNDGR